MRALKDAAYRWLGRRVRSPRPAPVVPPRKLLLFSHDSKLGDAITHTAFVSQLVAAYPGIELHVTTADGGGAFWQRDSRIKRVWPVPRRGFLSKRRIGRALWAERFDVAICWDFHRSLTSILLLRLAGARRVIGFSKPDIGLVDTSLDYDRWNFHVTEKYRRALAALGIERPPEALRYELGFAVAPAPLPFAGGKTILLNLFASTADRSFSPVRAAALIAALAAAHPDCNILLNRPPEFAAVVDELLEAYAADDRLRLAALPANSDPFAVFGAVAACDYVISPDTALVHVGAALDKPTLALFLDAPHACVWAPRSHVSESLVADAESIDALPIDKIVNAFGALRALDASGNTDESQRLHLPA